MKNNIIFLSSCLLLASTHAVADRPAVQDMPPPAVQDHLMFEESINKADSAMQPTTPLSTVEPGMQEEIIEVRTGDAVELQPGETLPIKLIDFPRRGMSMSKVQNELGRPTQVSNTVGQPPITHWTYADRVVYFEHYYVLHVVPRK